jgi:hypothetical protein
MRTGLPLVRKRGLMYRVGSTNYWLNDLNEFLGARPLILNRK